MMGGGAREGLALVVWGPEASSQAKGSGLGHLPKETHLFLLQESNTATNTPE